METIQFFVCVKIKAENRGKQRKRGEHIKMFIIIADVTDDFYRPFFDIVLLAFEKKERKERKKKRKKEKDKERERKDRKRSLFVSFVVGSDSVQHAWFILLQYLVNGVIFIHKLNCTTHTYEVFIILQFFFICVHCTIYHIENENVRFLKCCLLLAFIEYKI